jgi:two-component system, NarL family, nitrate/nitrite response regulator NarL
LTAHKAAGIIRYAGCAENYGLSWSPWPIGSEGETDIPVVMAVGSYPGKEHGFEPTIEVHQVRIVPEAAPCIRECAFRLGAPFDCRRWHGQQRRARVVTAIGDGGQGFMSVLPQETPGSLGIPARILVAGNSLLAGALASALTACGFATRHIVPREPEIEYGIEWRPNLVLVDVHYVDLGSGFAFVGELRRAGLRVCVIDAADDADRQSAWRGAGASALVDGSEPFDQLFQTVNRLLRNGPTPQAAGSPPGGALGLTYGAEKPLDPGLQPFAVLTEREQVVLAELMEGHCAEEIANAAFVSISTIRSQIKSVLQKLGVNSQLAAVALARRAGWSLESARKNAARASSGRRTRVG